MPLIASEKLRIIEENGFAFILCHMMTKPILISIALIPLKSKWFREKPLREISYHTNRILGKYTIVKKSDFSSFRVCVKSQTRNIYLDIGRISPDSMVLN